MFNRAARGMLHQDHITFAMLLAKISLKGITRSPLLLDTFSLKYQMFRY